MEQWKQEMRKMVADFNLPLTEKEFNLRQAVLIGTDISSADLRNADLRKVNLQEFDFTDKDLTGVNLSGSSLIGSNFTGAILRMSGNNNQHKA